MSGFSHDFMLLLLCVIHRKSGVRIFKREKMSSIAEGANLI